MVRHTHRKAHSARIANSAVLIGLIASVGLSGGGCVYYNTFYNARKYFNQAERENRPAPGRRGIGTAKRMYEDAITKAQKIVDKHPNSKYHDDALFMVGVSYFRMDEYARSERFLRELLATHPDSKLVEEAQLYLARCRMRLGDEQAGFRTFTELARTAKKKEWRAEATYQRGLYFDKIENHDSAATAFTRVFTEFPKSDRAIQARLEAGSQLRLINRPLDAIPVYEPLVEEEDPIITFQSMMGIANSYFEGGWHDSSIAILERMAEAEEYYDSIGTIRLGLGRALEGIGDRSGAWRQYEQVTAALELTSWSAEAYFRMAEIKQYDEGDLLAAKELYDASRREDSRGVLANQALSRSANITKLVQYRRTLGRSALTSGGKKDIYVDPSDRPPIEQEALYSTRESRPPSLDKSTSVLGPANPNAPERLGPPTPDEIPGEQTESALAAIEAAALEPFGPPLDLAPILGPPVSLHDVEFNRKRDDMLTDEQWWSLIKGDSTLLGPPSPAYIYTFGTGRLLGPRTPSDSAYAAWEEAARNAPAQLARESRAQAREKRKAELADVGTNATAQMQLAELYRFDLGYPDSALTEYLQLTEQYGETHYGAQALLAASDILINDLDDTAQGRQYLRQILEDYPRTDFASDAIRRLGLTGTAADTGHPAWAYAMIENVYLKDGNHDKAMELLQDFVKGYPYSRLVASAEYTMAALTDKYYASGDSAVLWAYQEIVTEYPESEFALAARERMKTTIDRPKRRQPAPVQQAEGQLVTGDSSRITETDSTLATLPLAPKPKNVGQFQFPESEIGVIENSHRIVFRIFVDYLGEITENEVLQPSPSYDITEAATLSLKDTRFWADSIPPDSLNMWYRYEMTIQPPAKAYDEFDQFGIDPHDPTQSLQDDK